MQMKQMKMYLMEPMQDQDWDEVLAEGVLKPLQGLTEQNIGWVSPYGPGHEAMYFSYGHFLVLCAASQKRLLPQSVVNEQSLELITAKKSKKGDHWANEKKQKSKGS